MEDRGSGSRGLVILAFHRVRREPDALFPNEPDARMFHRKMRWLARFFNVLSLRSAIGRLRDGTLPPRAVSITFDDGYADNVEVAFPILRELGLEATVFVATHFLSGENMWNDRIIESIRSTSKQVIDLTDSGLTVVDLSGIELRREAVGRLLAHAKYLDHVARDEFVRELERRAGTRICGSLMMTPDLVRDAAQSGMEIGAHTRTHPILSRISREAAQSEISGSKRDLESLLHREVALFAYPNGAPGKDYGQEHSQMVRALGFDGAVCTRWGVARSGDDPFQLPRMMPWDRDPLRFSARLAVALMRPLLRMTAQ
jgi:peptidoglycan/xylan/chitin deacetylase (PgdA/CDA1 family)